MWPQGFDWVLYLYGFSSGQSRPRPKLVSKLLFALQVLAHIWFFSLYAISTSYGLNVVRFSRICFQRSCHLVVILSFRKNMGRTSSLFNCMLASLSRDRRMAINRLKVVLSILYFITLAYFIGYTYTARILAFDPFGAIIGIKQNPTALKHVLYSLYSIIAGYVFVAQMVVTFGLFLLMKCYQLFVDEVIGNLMSGVKSGFKSKTYFNKLLAELMALLKLKQELHDNISLYPFIWYSYNFVDTSMRLMQFSAANLPSPIKIVRVYSFYVVYMFYLIGYTYYLDHFHRKEVSQLRKLRYAVLGSSLPRAQGSDLMFEGLIKDLIRSQPSLASILPLDRLFVFTFFGAAIPFSVLFQSLFYAQMYC